MITLLSPAKSLDYDSPCLTERSTQPRLKSDTAALIEQLKALSSEEVGSLMNISDKLALLNHERFQNFAPSFTKKNSRQAILAFTGDVYQGMNLRASEHGRGRRWVLWINDHTIGGQADYAVVQPRADIEEVIAAEGARDRVPVHEAVHVKGAKS